MKKLLFFIPVLVLMACSPKVKPVATTTVTEPPPSLPLFSNFADSASYVLGSSSSSQILEALQGTEGLFNQAQYLKGAKDGFDQKVIFTEEEKTKIIQEFQTRLQAAAKAKQEAVAKERKKLGDEFLAENATKEGVMSTASGLQYKVLEEGEGATPGLNDRVEVHYEGRLIDGTIFDSSYQRGSTATFGVGQVISGWTEGLQLMKEGAKYQFFIPSKLAYGDRATGKIKPGDTLIFDVELIKVIK